MPKLIIVSNRLPITAATDGDAMSLGESTGGLATGLAPVMKAHDTLWLGWPGALGRMSMAQIARLEAALEQRRCAPVYIPARDMTGFYNDFSNGVLWPLYHYQAERMPPELSGWDSYVRVNRHFADAVVARYVEGDTIWVHDYHLQLVPRMLRDVLPSARIGFFLHIPFPSSEVFRILPWRSEVLHGILGADVVGFHTHAYARHFASALVRVRGLDVQIDRVLDSGRNVRIGAFPLGVDVDRVAAAASPGPLAAALATLKAQRPDARLMLAIDRLDYTKGIPRRLLAFERLLERHPSLQGCAVLVQVAAPSRDDVPAYGRNKRQVEELIGRINGRFGLPGYQPIHYISRAVPQAEVLALFPHVDAMIVTPLRDGMNLVAKEFVACRDDDDGVLVLSEFAGAAAELGEAIQVNPYDVEGTADALHRALTMPADERQARMRALRRRIAQFDATAWARDFLSGLERSPEPEVAGFTDAAALAALAQAADRLVLFLDYDGTLQEIMRMPQLAAPDPDLRTLLRRVARNPRCEVHVVSGRPSATLDAWLGGLGVHLHAEHGAMSRCASDGDWTSQAETVDWQPAVRELLADFVKNTPGSFVEEKRHSLAWHYRMSDPQHAGRMANELRLHGRETLGSLGLEMMTGRKVIEIRRVGIDKGTLVRRVLTTGGGAGATSVAIGDDATDEDMFRALPDSGLAVVVGDRPSTASLRLRDPREVRRFLALLAEGEAG